MVYIRHDENNNSVASQPGVSTVSYLGGTTGWSTVTYQNWNADYQARNFDNTPRTPARYQRHDANRNPLGSEFFDGASDYLKVNSSSIFAVGSGALTIEFWYKWISGGSLTSFQVGSSSSNDVNIFIGDSANIGIWDGASPFINVASGLGSNLQDTWNHIAFVRTGTGANASRAYVNGSSVGTGTWNKVYSGNRIFYIGTNFTNSQFSYGYISNFRVVQSAVYTSNFTPPTSSFGPNDEADTVLLCCQGKGDGTVDATGTTTLVASGDAVGINSNPFQGTYQRYDENNSSVTSP